jgi:hypothetical protein
MAAQTRVFSGCRECQPRISDPLAETAPHYLPYKAGEVHTGIQEREKPLLCRVIIMMEGRKGGVRFPAWIL